MLQQLAWFFFGSMIMTTIEMTPEQKRKNVRTARLVAAFALFMMKTSVPFWKGLYQIAVNSGL